MTNIFQECINYSKYGGLDFNRLRSGSFEGPAIVIPPALPEDTYYQFSTTIEIPPAVPTIANVLSTRPQLSHEQTELIEHRLCYFRVF